MPLRIMLAAVLSFTAAVANPSPALLPPTIGIVLRFEHPPAPGFAAQLRREVEHIFRPTGLDLRWEVTDGKKQVGTYNLAWFVEMRGHCSSSELNASGAPLESGIPLGWTFVTDGEVLQHSVVDCERIARAISELRGRLANRVLLGNIYLRLAGRVMAHEMMHALLQTPQHSDSGFSRLALRLEDLQVDLRLKPEEVARLRRLGRDRVGVSLARR